MHVLNTGVVRAMVSTTNNFNPDVLARGKWLGVNMPIHEYGDSGRVVLAGCKYLTQRYILRRHAKPGDCPIVLWCDEAQNVCNSFDATFLAECRSHLGAMVWLTQSIDSYYAAMGGASGTHRVNALLGNFLTKIVHACRRQDRARLCRRPARQAAWRPSSAAR